MEGMYTRDPIEDYGVYCFQSSAEPLLPRTLWIHCSLQNTFPPSPSNVHQLSILKSSNFVTHLDENSFFSQNFLNIIFFGIEICTDRTEGLEEAVLALANAYRPRNFVFSLGDEIRRPSPNYSYIGYNDVNKQMNHSPILSETINMSNEHVPGPSSMMTPHYCTDIVQCTYTE